MAGRIASFLLCLFASGALADNFIASCDSNSVKIDGKYVTANCKSITGQVKCTRLDLSNCLKNNYGSLQDDPSGKGPHFTDSCTACSNEKTSGGILISGPTLLHCQCNDGLGGASSTWPTAIFDINTIVDNNNGVLACHGWQAQAWTSC